MIDAGALVLDARGDEAKAPFLPHAHALDWRSTRYGAGAMGRLDDDLDQVRRALAKAGVDGKAPILVYGAMSSGFGEEARIWWTLRYLGLGPARILDGGVGAWVKDHKKVADRPEPASAIADAEAKKLVLQLQPRFRADWRAVDTARQSGTAAVLDNRSIEEWNGATLFGEPKGGHIPGAKHFEWRVLIGPNDRLIDREAALQRLKEAGVVSGTPVITYCTSGVRAAFVQAVLLHYGFQDVANYDGSFFDWTSRTKLPVERPPRR